MYTTQLFKDRGGKSEWGKLKPAHRSNKVSIGAFGTMLDIKTNRIDGHQ